MFLTRSGSPGDVVGGFSGCLASACRAGDRARRPEAALSAPGGCAAGRAASGTGSQHSSAVRFWSWTSDSGTHRVILRTSRGVQLVRRELEGGGHPDRLLGSLWHHDQCVGSCYRVKLCPLICTWSCSGHFDHFVSVDRLSAEIFVRSRTEAAC